jgi:hypothetical protein
MSDIVAEALARTLRLDDRLSSDEVYADPPEGVHQTPAAVVLETTGNSGRDGFRGLWEIEVTTRVFALLETRRELEINVNTARPWLFRLLKLFAEHDELLDEEGTIFGEIQGIEFTSGALTYGSVQYIGIELNITARVDVNVAVTCGAA